MFPFRPIAPNPQSPVPISPSFTARTQPNAPSRLRPPVVTLSSWQALPAPARPCSQGAFPRSFLRSSLKRLPSLPRSTATFRPSPPASATVRFALPTLVPLKKPSSVAARILGPFPLRRFLDFHAGRFPTRRCHASLPLRSLPGSASSMHLFSPLLRLVSIPPQPPSRHVSPLDPCQPSLCSGALRTSRRVQPGCCLPRCGGPSPSAGARSPERSPPTRGARAPLSTRTGKPRDA